jgi:uncharacterized protein YraI
MATTLHGQSVGNASIIARRGPALSYPILTALSKGARVPITGRSADGAWWQVVVHETPDSVLLAWVPVAALRTQGNESSVPQVWVIQEGQP